MKISIFTDKSSWFVSNLDRLKLRFERMGHECRIYNKITSEVVGDIAFFLSYFHIVSAENLRQHKNNLVVHESDLPKGRGWSPLTWQVIEGKNEVIVSLIEAALEVDAGDIYLQKRIYLEGHELVDEIRSKQADVTIELCEEFVLNYPSILNSRKSQSGQADFYKRRDVSDSKIDERKTIIENFNLLRVVDNERYPAWFEVNGYKYVLTVKKLEE